MFKEYRCQNCRKLFFKGVIKHATIEIKCRNCKELSTIRGNNCKLWMLADERGKYERSDGSQTKPKNIISTAVTECEQCKKINYCQHYQDMKNQKICPICKKSR